jgi:hypothetical protein
MDKEKNYHAYLLRLWRENDNAPWRVTLQDSRTGEKIGFTDLKKFSDYLEDKTEGRLLDFGSNHP